MIHQAKGDGDSDRKKNSTGGAEQRGLIEQHPVPTSQCYYVMA
jgi:hypothetical protein